MKQRETCDLCGGRDARIVYALDRFNVRECRGCGLRYRDVLFDAEETRTLYGETYFTDEQTAYFFTQSEHKHKILRDRLARIGSLYPGRGRMLDVGCAIGTFLAIARDAGWEVQGVEVSPYAAQYAREKNGFAVVTGEVAEAGFPPGSFDVVTMWDVIEHIEKPQELLRQAADLLKPGGLLAMSTNMEDSLLCGLAHVIHRVSGGLITTPVVRNHPVHHATFYSTRTLRLAVERAGLTFVGYDASDLDPALINTNTPMRWILRGIGVAAAVVGRPLEKIIYARK